MIPTKIFLDLDDVCNRFTPFALAHVGCPVDSMSYDNLEPRLGWDIVIRANTLHPDREFTKDEFWRCFDQKAWEDIPESEEFKELLSFCERAVGWRNICILTTPVPYPGCLEGKRRWIEAHFPSQMHEQYLIGKPKHFCASPDALLIDDADHNVEAFVAYDGQTILLPRPWNGNRNVSIGEFWPRLRGMFI